MTTSATRWRSWRAQPAATRRAGPGPSSASRPFQLRRHTLDRGDKGFRGEDATELVPIEHRHPDGLMNQHLREGVVQRPVGADDGIERTGAISDPALILGIVFGQLADRLAVAIDDD